MKRTGSGSFEVMGIAGCGESPAGMGRPGRSQLGAVSWRGAGRSGTAASAAPAPAPAGARRRAAWAGAAATCGAAAATGDVSTSARTGRGGENTKPWASGTSRSRRSGTSSARSTRSRDELDAGPRQHRGEIVELDVEPVRCLGGKKHLGRELDEAHAAVGERKRIEAQIGRPVEREDEAAVAKLRQRPALSASSVRQQRCDSSSTSRPVRSGWASTSRLTARRKPGFGKRGRGEVAGDEGLAAARGEMAGDGGGAGQHLAVEVGHEPAPLEHRQELGRNEERAVVEPQPRQSLVELHLALRQGHHRLEMKLEPVAFEGRNHRGIAGPIVRRRGPLRQRRDRRRGPLTRRGRSRRGGGRCHLWRGPWRLALHRDRLFAGRLQRGELAVVGRDGDREVAQDLAEERDLGRGFLHVGGQVVEPRIGRRRRRRRALRLEPQEALRDHVEVARELHRLSGEDARLQGDAAGKREAARGQDP